MSRLCRLKTASHGEDGKWAYEEIVKLRAELAALKAENESLRKDAERYRFIKDTPWSKHVAEFICHHQNAAWDNVIDDVMAQGEKG